MAKCLILLMFPEERHPARADGGIVGPTRLQSAGDAAAADGLRARRSLVPLDPSITCAADCRVAAGVAITFQLTFLSARARTTSLGHFTVAQR
jgi:hypothetical protein